MTERASSVLDSPRGKYRSMDGLATVRVLLLGHHCMVRMGMKLVLEEAPDIMVVAEVDSVGLAAEAYRRMGPDVVVADFFVPGIDMAMLAQRIFAQDTKAKIVLVGVYPAERYAAGMLQAGVLGFVTVGDDPSDLHRAVRAVAEGRRFLSDAVKDAVTTQLLDQKTMTSPAEKLSRRELQILTRVAAGQKLSEIAKELCLGVKTVHTYKYRLCLKLSLRTDADITRFAIENRLLDQLDGLGRSVAVEDGLVSDHSRWQPDW